MMSRSSNSRANAEIVKSDVMIEVRTWNLTVMCEFIFSRLPLHLRQKKREEDELLFFLTKTK